MACGMQGEDEGDHTTGGNFGGRLPNQGGNIIRLQRIGGFQKSLTTRGLEKRSPCWQKASQLSP